MFPESDPYAGKGGKIFDLLLILFAIAVILFAILTAPRRQAKDNPRESPAPTPLASNTTR